MVPPLYPAALQVQPDCTSVPVEPVGQVRAPARSTVRGANQSAIDDDQNRMRVLGGCALDLVGTWFLCVCRVGTPGRPIFSVRVCTHRPRLCRRTSVGGTSSRSALALPSKSPASRQTLQLGSCRRTGRSRDPKGGLMMDAQADVRNGLGYVWAGCLRWSAPARARREHALS